MGSEVGAMVQAVGTGLQCKNLGGRHIQPLMLFNLAQSNYLIMLSLYKGE